MKMRVLGLYILILAVLCTACGSKQAITSEQFIEKMEAAGYEIVDETEKFNEGEVEAILLAMKDDYQLEFFELPSNDQAVAAFNNNKSNFEQMEGNGTSNSSVSMANYNFYKLTTSDGYYAVSRIDNTVVYVNVPKEYKKEVQDVLKELGY